jgi:site-specific recombinase XerD
LAQGVQAKFLQEMLGHNSAAPTLDKYSHVLPSMSAATATAMDAVLS